MVTVLCLLLCSIAACALIVFISPCDCYHFGFSFKYLSGNFNYGDNVAEFGKIRYFNPRQNEISKNLLRKRNKIYINPSFYSLLYYYLATISSVNSLNNTSKLICML